MGYPDNVLAADEQVVLHRHPHWKRLVGPVLVLIISTALAAFGAAVVDKPNWEHRQDGGATGDPRRSGC